MAKGEALDAVTTTRPFAAVHIIATAMLVAGGSSDDELELARRILAKDPKRDEPRENESVAGAFNRQMDAAIESCNASSGEATRAYRRALLARDLDRADLVLMDRAMLAALFATIGELRLQVQTLELERSAEEDLGAELLADEPGMILYQEAREISPEVFQRVTGGPIGGSMQFANGGSIDFDGDGGSFSGLEFIEGTGVTVPLDPGVND